MNEDKNLYASVSFGKYRLLLVKYQSENLILKG